MIAPEVRVQHRGDLVGVVPLGEGRVAGEVGEDDAHLASARERLVEVERAEPLLVPLRSRDERDQQERAEHQHVPLPPRDLPVPRPRDHDHRLGEQHEGEREGEHEPLLPPAMEAEEAEGGDPEQRDAERREDELPAVELLGGERVVERRELGERDDRPGDDERRERRRGARAPRAGRIRPLAARARATTRRRRAPASTRPTGVASSKPAFDPRSTPGVASACSPRNAALTTNASEMRSRRASLRRRAAVVTLKPSAVATSAAPRTSQKCAGWFSQSRVDRRSCEEDDEEDQRCNGDGDPGAGTHPVKYPRGASILTAP